MTKIISLLRKKRVWIPLVILVLIVGILIWRFSSSSTVTYQTVTVGQGTVHEEVSVVGKIQPTERLDLGLLSSGRIAYVGTKEGARVRRGQTLVSLSSADLEAQLDGALATLNREQIRLEQLRGGARDESVAVTQATTDAARTTRDNAQRTLAVQLRDSFTSADSAFGSNIDQFFEDARSGNPHFGVTLSSGGTTYTIKGDASSRSRLEYEQTELVRRMKEWNTALGSDQPADLDAASTLGASTLAYAQTYLADLAGVVNSYRPSTSGEQTLYDGLQNSVASARTSISAASSGLLSAQNAFQSAQANLTVNERQLAVKTGASADADIRIQEATVRGAQASVNGVRAQIAKNAVVSPVDGVVTNLNAKVGENAGPSSPAVTVMADAQFEIEAKVPEADIAKIKVDDTAKVTLDAYTGETFEARVVYVAPAETLVDGVPTYKIKLQLTKDDARLKPGMTADLDISTNTRENVLVLPQRAIITKDGNKVVRVKNGDTVKDVVVTTGIRGVDGNVEITGGLVGGEEVVTGTTTS